MRAQRIAARDLARRELVGDASARPTGEPHAPSEHRAQRRELAAPAAIPEHFDRLIVGGGTAPDSNPVSLEDDVRLASEVLGDERSVRLFAGGPGTLAVQVQDAELRGDELLAEIGDFLAPRAGRDAHYRATNLVLHGASTWTQTAGLLELALGRSGPPLLVYVAGHGDGGETPLDSRTLFWGGEGLDAVTLTEWLAARPRSRQARFVVTSCFSGGLGEIAFEGADRARGATSLDVCGVFATSWDEEASGCDPDPVRAHHDGFGVHFLEALRGRARDGSESRDAFDLDHDGAIGLTEALTASRIASRSIDIPTTTSEVLLRGLAPRSGPRSPFRMPEQDAVIHALSEAMRLATRDEALARLGETSARKVELDAALVEASDVADAAYFEATAEVLSQWPVLDDPFHPDFEATITAERDAIAAFFESSPAIEAYRRAQDEVDAMSSTELALRLELALLRRLVDAYETIELAERLHAAGGASWEAFLRLRACEWSAP